MSHIDSPVLAADSRIALILSLVPSPEPMSGADVTRMGEQLAAVHPGTQHCARGRVSAPTGSLTKGPPTLRSGVSTVSEFPLPLMYRSLAPVGSFGGHAGCGATWCAPDWGSGVRVQILSSPTDFGSATWLRARGLRQLIKLGYTFNSRYNPVGPTTTMTARSTFGDNRRP